jgi:hypothetical protein
MAEDDFIPPQRTIWLLMGVIAPRAVTDHSSSPGT